MREVNVSGLSDRYQVYFQSVEKGLAFGNFTYVVEVCRSILKKHPGCAAARDLLHKAQVNRYSRKKVFQKGWDWFLGRYYAAKAYVYCKANSATKGLSYVEKWLSLCPQSKAGLKLLATTARALDFTQTEILARRDLLLISPENVEVQLALGDAYIRAGEPEKAIAVGESILEKDPAQGEALLLVQQASVAYSLSKTSWE